MKKVLFLIVSFVLVFSLISCQNEKTEEEKEAPAVEQPTTVDSSVSTADTAATEVAPVDE